MLPVLRSRHQADILALLLLHPDQEYTISELVDRLSISQSTVSDEVRRLSEAGILTDRMVGRARLVHANLDSRLVPALTELVTLTYGPHVVIGEEFADLEDVERVVIFGSWAARSHGVRGRPPNDIDVLVVGAPARIAMYSAAERAETRLGWRVNPVVCPPEEWTEPNQPFIREIKARPFLTVVDRSRDAKELS